MSITRLQLHDIIREELSRIIEQPETIPAQHIIHVGTPFNAVPALDSEWQVSARVTDLEGGILDASDVRGAASATDANTKINAWVKQMTAKYEDAKVKASTEG